MAENEPFVLVFVPPLATLLADAEARIGRPLTESEVMQLRDRATCVNVPTTTARELDVTRGFRDVNASNCWIDWQRLRPEMTGGFMPNLVLCVLGGDDLATRSKPILEAARVEFELRDRDDRMADAFEAAVHREDPSMTGADRRAIDEHRAVVYLVGGGVTSGAALVRAQEMLQLGARLLDEGGVAMKCESSGIAHGRARRTGLASQAANHPSPGAAMFRAFVQHPIADREDVYTCGMHLLGHPDLIGAKRVLALDDDLLRSSADTFRAFATYLLTECPTGAFGAGHTFRTHASSSRFRVVWEPCRGFDEDDFFFNPYGRWRFVERV